MLKFGIVGIGNIGKRHLAVLDNLPNAEVTAVCDINIKAAQDQASLYSKDILVYDNYASFLESADVDVVCICTPHEFHCEMSIAAAEKKKHIMVEKPMALTTQDANKMIQAAEKNGVELAVMKQNRFNVPIKLTKQVLEEGRLGKVFMVKCDVLWNRNPEYYTKSDWRGKPQNEGGALFTQVSHFLDLLIWWFGDVTDARTMIDTKLHKIEVEDCGSSTVNFESGVMGNIFWTTCVYNKNYEGSITIIGEKGTIKIGGKYLNKIDYWDVQSYPLPDNVVFEDKPNLYGKYQGTSSNHDKVYVEFIKMLEGKAHENVVDGGEGLRSIEAIKKIYQTA